ncbi:uncharacterized protein ISCGN_030598 [Ixodes scapularis]
MNCSSGNSAHDGIRYYLQRARELSFDEANSIRAVEFVSDSSYRQAWQGAEQLYGLRCSWTGLCDVMEKECYLAIISYTAKKPNVCRSLNACCRRAEANRSSWDAFPYKSLWFFLIRAFEKLPPCSQKTLFRGVDVFNQNPDDSVTFSQFISASVSQYWASRFGHRKLLLTLNGIPSELVRDISNYSFFTHHQEVLIWPFCTFKLVSESSGKKELDFVSAVPGVERGTQLVTMSLLGASSATLSEAVPPLAARVQAKALEAPKVSKERFHLEFPQIHTVPKLMKLGTTLDAREMLPEVPRTSSGVQPPLLQCAHETRATMKPALAMDGTPQQLQALLTLHKPEELTAEETSPLILKPCVIGDAVPDTATVPSSACTSLMANIMKPDIITPIVLKPPRVPLSTQGFMKDVTKVTPKTWKPSMHVPKTPITACTVLPPLPEINRTAPGMAKPTMTAGMFQTSKGPCTTESQLLEADHIAPNTMENDLKMDMSKTPATPCTTEPLQLQRNVMINIIDVQKMPCTTDTVLQCNEMMPNIIKSSVNLFEAAGRFNTPQSPLPQSDQTKTRTVEPSIAIDLSNALHSSEPEFSQNDLLVPKTSKVILRVDMSEAPRPSQTTEFLLPQSDHKQPKVAEPGLSSDSSEATRTTNSVPQLHQMAKTAEPSEVVHLLEIPETAARTPEFPQTEGEGMVLKIPDLDKAVPETSCAMEPPLITTTSPSVITCEPFKSPHTKECFPLHLGEVAPNTMISAMAVGGISDLSRASTLWCKPLTTKTATVKPYGMFTAVSLGLRVPLLNMDNALPLTHVVPGPQMLSAAKSPRAVMALESLVVNTPNISVNVSGSSVDEVVQTTELPIMEWHFGTVITQKPTGTLANSIPGDVLICDESQSNRLEEDGIDILVSFFLVMIFVIAVINYCFIF